MKKDLINLIDSQDEIEKMFHVSEGGILPAFEKIYDVQEFQDWIQEIKLELQDVFDCTQDQFVLETIHLCEKKMDGMTDRRIFSELIGKLRAIRKNIERYYPDEECNYQNKSEVKTNKELKPLIFVSHSSKNKEQVKLLVEMLRAINLQPKQDIFCSSLPGYDIPIDTDERIFDFLRNSFLSNKIHVFFIHSHEYYESPVSLNEMGAAWALKSNQTSLLLPGFKFSDMKGVINGERIAIKLDHDITEVKDKLNQVRWILEKEFPLNPVQDTIWEQARDIFIEEINHLKVKEQQSRSYSDDAVELLKKLAATPEGILLTPFDTTNGVTIQVGQEAITSEYPNRREYARWNAALKECITAGLIEQKNENFYVITNSGYNVAEG